MFFMLFYLFSHAFIIIIITFCLFSLLVIVGIEMERDIFFIIA